MNIDGAFVLILMLPSIAGLGVLIWRQQAAVRETDARFKRIDEALGIASTKVEDFEPPISVSERRKWHYDLYRSHGGSASYEDWRKVQRMWGG